MIRVAVIFNNYSTFGHARVVFSLLKSLKSISSNKIQVKVIEIGLRKTGIFPVDKCDSYSFFALSEDPGGNVYTDMNESDKERLMRIKSALKQFKPQILVTEFYPFCHNSSWLGFEAILKFIKEKLNTKIISCSSYPDWSSRTERIFNRYYDQLIVHIPGELSDIYRRHLENNDLGCLHDFLKRNVKKIYYSGFLSDPCFSRQCLSALRKSLNLDNRKLIFVSRGGQKVYRKIPLIALQVADKHREWFFLIQEDKDFPELGAVSRRLNNVKIIPPVYPESEDYMRAADVNINLAGYNTTVMLLSHKLNSIAFPLSHSEQLWNASLLFKFTKAQIMDINKTGPLLLESKIKKMLVRDASQKLSGSKRSWFKGARRSADMIIKLRRSL